MAERPIPLRSHEVRAILAGTKTQTRRVVKQQPQRCERGVLMWTVSKYRKIGFQARDVHPDLHEFCPYGQPGDRLWVRETWAQHPQSASTVFYRATVEAEPGFPVWDGPWRPSIHMPRSASRITLEITGVRVERLQDISEADAVAEGVMSVQCNDLGAEVPYYRSLFEPSGLYRLLWESINGPGSWDANPWVWVVEFKRLREAAGGGEG